MANLNLRGVVARWLTDSPLLALLVAPVAMACALAWPWSGTGAGHAPWATLQIVAMAVFANYLHSSTHRRQAAWRTWVFATVYLATSFHWLYVAMHTYGGLPSVLAVLAVAALAAALALYYALAAALYWSVRTHGVLWACLAFAALWTLAEMARGIWFTGFGWGAIGYAHVDGWLSGLFPWVGVYGVGAVAAAMAMACVQARSVRGAMVVAMVLLLGWGASWMDWTKDTGQASVALLQGNIPQDEKFVPGGGVPLALAWYKEQIPSTSEQLVVLPETAIPLLPQSLPDDYWAQWQSNLRTGQAVLVGLPTGRGDWVETNSAWAMTNKGWTQWRYDKHHLVPFGEFIPPWFKWFTEMMRIPLGDFQRGSLTQDSFAWQGQRFGVHICYEDLFGEELAQRFAEPQRAPTVMVNLSNLAWFGDSIALSQHLQIARARALELQRPFVRATNTGATAIVDHQGQVQALAPVHTRLVLQGVVTGRSGVTPYAWWVSRAGLWPMWLILLVIVGCAYRGRRTPVK